jgi:hypothetical protein
MPLMILILVNWDEGNECSRSSTCLAENHYKFVGIKKLGKGRQEWESACKEIGLKPQKFKTLIKIRFTSKVVFFQETLEYVVAINLCYN